MKVKLGFIVCLGLSLLISRVQANELDNFHGTWKEIGYRCVGDQDFKPRPWPARKLFTIGGYSYTHRVEFTDRPNCEFVESSGGLATIKSRESRWLGISIHPKAYSSCYENTPNPLVDDFISERATLVLWITLEEINGNRYMIVAGDPGYVDPWCNSNPIVERIYSKH